MPSGLITSLLTLLWIKGVFLNKEKQVFQTPAELVLEPNTEAKIDLRHEIQGYNTILWYQRSAGDATLKLIGYMYFQIPTVEPEFSSRFKVSGDGATASSLQILNLTPSEDSAEYFGAARTGGYSEAYFGAGTKLTVLEPELDIVPPTVKVLEPSPNECNQGKKKTLVCVASDFYPDHVKVHWQVDGVEVTEGVATDNAAWRNGTGKKYTITSRLMVNETTWYTPSNEFKCIVRFYDGAAYVNKEDSVTGEKAQIKHESPLTRERYLRITQGAKLSYGVFIIKSCTYGAFVAFLVWKLQKSAEKQST